MGPILVILALAVVAIILFAGLAVMSIGGSVAKEWSNRLMRYRVIAQAVAILIVILVLYFAGQSASH
jgi:ABC-type arginine transport system permease subunit